MRRVAQLLTADARGEDRTLTPFCGQGILSPAIAQVSPEQTPLKGPSEIARGTERNRKESRRYHIRYHAPDALVERWREEQETK